MNCGKCGHQLTSGAVFCGNCGAPIQQAPPAVEAQTVPVAPPAPHKPNHHSGVQSPVHGTSPAVAPHTPNPPAYQSVQLHPSSKYNEMAIIAAILLFFFPPASVVLGFISLSQIKQSHEQGRGVAIASIIIGGLILLFFVLIIVVAAMAPSYSDSGEY